MALEEQLRRERWYLGEVTEEAAESVLQSCPRFNVFVVYSKPGGTGYVLSARLCVKDVDEDTLEHIQISPTEGGQYKLPGQAEAYDDLIAAVNSYVAERDPPLTPALSKSSEKQLSVSDDPPSYSEAIQAPACNLAPLPDITAVNVEPVKEATTGDISPTSSPEHRQQTGRGSSGRAPPPVDPRDYWRSPYTPQPYVVPSSSRRRNTLGDIANCLDCCLTCMYCVIACVSLLLCLCD